MTTTGQSEDISLILEKLIRRQDLEAREAERIADLLADHRLSQAQAAAFLVLLRAKGETGTELLAIAQAMRRKAIVPNPLPKLNSHAPLVDIVGTGGDGHDTVNLSTASAIVSAACGARVAKHGNRSASSRSGSADVLEALGVPMLDPNSVSECLDRTGIAFLFAPHFHPALVPIGPVRKSLGVKTIFNVLGPLLNPLSPKHMVLGVYTPSLLGIYADAVEGLHAEHALIVHCSGLDELAAVGEAEVVEVKRGSPRKLLKIDPLELCEKCCTIDDLKGGDAKHNAQIIRILLENGGGPELKGCFDTIAINAGAVLYVSGLASSIKEGFAKAQQCMRSGQALAKLDELASVAQELHSKRTKLNSQ